MYCSECGQQAFGKFCSHCGTRLQAAGQPGDAAPPLRVIDGSMPAQAAAAEPSGDWERELRYEALLALPHVRDAINRHASLARKSLSGEEFLQLCEKVMPSGVPLDKVALLAQPLYAKLGIATGKQRQGQILAPVGRVMLRMLCSLARRGQNLRLVRQADDGCFFEAVLPSDVLSFEGELMIGVRQLAGGTEVNAATQIKGQFFDWGKSQRCLDNLFADLHQDAA